MFSLIFETRDQCVCLPHGEEAGAGGQDERNASEVVKVE